MTSSADIIELDFPVAIGCAYALGSEIAYWSQDTGQLVGKIVDRGLPDNGMIKLIIRVTERTGLN